VRIDVVKSELSLSFLSTTLKLSAWMHVSLNTNLPLSKLKYIIGVGAWKVLSYTTQWTSLSWLFRQEIFWQWQHSFSILVYTVHLYLIHCFQVSKISSQNPKLWLSFVFIGSTLHAYMSRQQLKYPLQCILNTLNTPYGEHFIFWYHYVYPYIYTHIVHVR